MSDPVVVKKKPRPFLGRAVDKGQLRFTSASQIATFSPDSDGCHRKFAYQYVFGIKLAKTPAQLAGNDYAEKLETWLTRGEMVLPSTLLVGKHLFPLPTNSKGEYDLECELPLGDMAKAVAMRDVFLRGEWYLGAPVDEEMIRRAAGVTAAGVPLEGAADFRHRRQEYIDENGVLRPEHPNAYVVEIGDLKTVSRIDDRKVLKGKRRGEIDRGYAKTAAGVCVQPQMLAYGIHAADAYSGVTHLRLSHVYCGTQRKEASKRTGLLSVEEVRRRWVERVEPVVRQMIQVAGAVKIEDVEANTNACDSYNHLDPNGSGAVLKGCGYRYQCPLSRVQVSQVIQNSIRGASMSTGTSLFSQLAPGAQPEAPPSPPSPPAPPQSPADREAEIADHKAQLLAEEARAQAVSMSPSPPAPPAPPAPPDPPAPPVPPDLDDDDDLEAEDAPARLLAMETEFGITTADLIAKVKAGEKLAPRVEACAVYWLTFSGKADLIPLLEKNKPSLFVVGVTYGVTINNSIVQMVYEGRSTDPTLGEVDVFRDPTTGQREIRKAIVPQAMTSMQPITLPAFMSGVLPPVECRVENAGAILPPDAPKITSMLDAAAPIPAAALAEITDPEIRAACENHNRKHAEKAAAEAQAAPKKVGGRCPGGGQMVAVAPGLKKVTCPIVGCGVEKPFPKELREAGSPAWPFPGHNVPKPEAAAPRSPPAPPAPPDPPKQSDMFAALQAPPVPDVHIAVSPEAIDQVLATDPPMPPDPPSPPPPNPALFTLVVPSLFVEFDVVASESRPGDVSLRTIDGAHGGHVKQALREVGFRPGDRIRVQKANVGTGTTDRSFGVPDGAIFLTSDEAAILVGLFKDRAQAIKPALSESALGLLKRIGLVA